ncbi:hypothetical protein B0J13DRAFT_628552 [Dactylonectria estremocensis]|uniref:Uncharacterized protein n=1 Tax=Dactylonectria estremocensis TaxID=1079267 RepID=A0A9P9DQW6_9HYPO|nr:hypothetical protein B0J13DRAFT_628552 [Dactylonectria estremocensis]
MPLSFQPPYEDNILFTQPPEMAEFGSQPEWADKPHLANRRQTFYAWNSGFELGRKSGHDQGYHKGFDKGYWSGFFSPSLCQCGLGRALPSPQVETIDDAQPGSTGEYLLNTTKKQPNALAPSPPLMSSTSIPTGNPEAISLPIDISAMSQTGYSEATPTTSDLETSLAKLSKSISPIQDSIPTPEPSLLGHEPASLIGHDSPSSNGSMPLGNLSLSGVASHAQEQNAIDSAKGSSDFGEGLIPSTPHTISLSWDNSVFSTPPEGVVSPGASPSDLFSPVDGSPSLSPSANDTAPGLSNPLDPNPLGSSDINGLAPTSISNGDSTNSPALEDEQRTVADAEALRTTSSSPTTSYEGSVPLTPHIDDTVVIWIDEVSSPPSPPSGCSLADVAVPEDSDKAFNHITQLFLTEESNSNSKDIFCPPAEYLNRKRSAGTPSNPPSPKRTKDNHSHQPDNSDHGTIDKSEQPRFYVEEIQVQPKGTDTAFTVSWSRRVGEWVEKDIRGKVNQTFNYTTLLDIADDFLSITGRRYLGWSPVELYFKNDRWQGRDVLGDWKIEVQSSSIELALAMGEERSSITCEACYIKL